MATKNAMLGMPAYRSHKIVTAMKITKLAGRAEDGLIAMEVSDEITGKINVQMTVAWGIKHDPTVGGYLVQYEDGYLSFSPSKAFEGGYTRIDDVGETVTFQQLMEEHRFFKDPQDQVFFAVPQPDGSATSAVFIRDEEGSETAGVFAVYALDPQFPLAARSRFRIIPKRGDTIDLSKRAVVN